MFSLPAASRRPIVSSIGSGQRDGARLDAKEALLVEVQHDVGLSRPDDQVVCRQTFDDFACRVPACQCGEAAMAGDAPARARLDLSRAPWNSRG